MKLDITPEVIRAMIALEDNRDFQYLMKVMHDRVDSVAAWSCMPSDMTYEQRSWMQGRVQEMADWLYAWTHRRSWRETLRPDPPDGKMGSDGSY